MTHPNSPQSEFLRGIKETSPMLIGLLPWALILGMQGGQKGMSWLEMLMMTGMNFAGGSGICGGQPVDKPVADSAHCHRYLHD